MTELVLLLIAVGGGALLVAPILRESRQPWIVAAPSGEGEALRQEELVSLEALRDLAMDFKLGNLSEADYRSLAMPLQARLKQTHALQTEHEGRQAATLTVAPDLDRILEEQIRAARRVHEQPSTGTNRNGRNGTGSARFCHQCGARVAADHRFCAACGTSLTAAAPQVEAALFSPGSSTAAATTAPETLLPTAETEQEATTDEPVRQDATARGGRRWLWWGAAAVAVVWVAVVVGIYVNGRNSQTAGTPLAQFEAPIETITGGGDVLLLGTRDGVLLSNDGRTWTATALSEPALTVAPLDEIGERWLAATTLGLQRSDDGGDTWLPLPQVDLGFVDLASMPQMGVVWGLTDSALYVSEDEGETWTLLSSTLPGRGQTLAVGPGQIFVGTDQGIFASRNGGQNWSPQNGSVNGRIVSLDVRSLAYDGANELLYAGTPAGLSFLNLARGGSWGQRSLQGVVTALRLSGEDNQVLWVGTQDGRLFRSPSRGVRWQ